MAVTWMSGLEAQQAQSDKVTLNGTASISTAQQRTGAASLRCNPASGASGYATPASFVAGFHHFGLFIASAPTVERQIWGSPTTNYLTLTNTTLKLYDNGGVLLGSCTISTGVWVWVGIRATGVSATGDFLQLDGISAITGTTKILSGTGAVFGLQDTGASAVDLYYDDIIVDDTGFLAPSKVDMALPISDNGAHTGWQAGAAGATNLWQGIDNTPPAGLASASETNTSNIENTGTAGTYTANLETYATLGIVADDTVLAVGSVIRHGEDIATGTKAFNAAGALTNPTYAGFLITVGADGGAHGAEAGLWLTEWGAIQASPSVTLGTSPTIAVTRPAESRTACIDFLGMLVAWTPAVAAQVPHVSPYPQLLPH